MQVNDNQRQLCGFELDRIEFVNPLLMRSGGSAIMPDAEYQVAMSLYIALSDEGLPGAQAEATT